jgi:tetratricopeptide (TPR) repeat protein
VQRMRNFLLVLLIAACSQPAKQQTTPTPTAAASQPAAAAKDFDHEKVRADFFDGMRGDAEAMARAMKVCEETLAANPKHAEAMVWHGAGVVGRASAAFRTGDRQTGIALYQQGIAEMDAAVALEPDNIGVRIPRGAVLLAMAPFVPEPERTKLLERGVGDYEKTYTLQAHYFPQLTLHAREQLLYGLTDGYANLGKLDKATTYYEKMKTSAADSELLPRAASRARGETVDGAAPCEQCHQ